jgi:hypothetical protein
VSGETRKLRGEIDQQSKDNSSYNQLEKRYENLSKEKEKLEGDLADYNLAMDKTRTSTGIMCCDIYIYTYIYISPSHG